MTEKKKTSPGDRSTGDRSTGHLSTGNWSTGNWSTGDWSTGHLSTEDYAPFGLFNQPMTKEEVDGVDWPRFFYFDLTSWVESDEMSEGERVSNPTHSITGGFLRVYEYQEAWQRSWDKAGEYDRRKVLALPHWDNEVFEEISGIDVEAYFAKAEGPKIEVAGKSYLASDVEKALGGIKPVE